MGRELTADDLAKLIAARPIGDTLSDLGRPRQNYAEARAIDPSWRTQLYDLANKHLGKAAAKTLVGEDIGLADFVPGLGTALQGQEGMHSIQEGAARSANGDTLGGYLSALGGTLGVLPGVGAVAKGAKPLAKTAAPLVGDALDSYMGKIGAQLNVAPPARFRGKHLEGMPELVDMGGGRMEPFTTDQRLVDIAGNYMADKGLPYKEMTKYAPLDVKRAGALAQAFTDMKHAPDNRKVARAYENLLEETQAQYEALLKAGYKFDFIKGADPYGNPRNAINDLIENKHMSVFPTLDGFGSSDMSVAGNPLLRLSDLKIGDGEIPTTYNDLFRAVHDAFGHAQHGVGFRARGEENAFQSHARMYSPDAVPAATSETRGQNSWVNYGPHGEYNRSAAPDKTIYADQKTGIMPDWTWIDGVGD